VLQDFGGLKNVTSPHLLREILKPIFPIVRGEGEIICQYFEEHFAFAGGNG
jgi:hypothetical protein